MKKLLICLLVFSTITSVGCNQKSQYKNNSISTAHPLATKAGIEMYKLGGNAADAAVAAAFTLAVVEPSMSGIGGRLQAIVRNLNETSGIDASTVVPISFKENTNDKDGYKTIGVPGVVAGLLELQKTHGNLSLDIIMKPAINYAKFGFNLLEGEVYRHQLAKKSIEKNKGSSYHFLKKDGSTYNTSDLFIQEDLAKTLTAIKDRGRKGFYEGEIAKKIAADIQSNGGYISLEDLKNYQVKKSKILKTYYKGYLVESLYLPSFGAITLNILNILNHFNLSLEKEAEDIYVTNESIRIAYEKRKYQTNKDSLKSILSFETSEKEAQLIKKNIRNIYLKKENEPVSWNVPQGHTSHLTSADKNGMVISLTQTIGPLMGSKVTTKGLGFLYAVTMGGYLGDYKPGDRANSHISPTLVSKNNKVILALGAAGGNKIVTAIVQTIKNIIDLELNLDQAIARGRVYPVNDSIQIEGHKGIKWSEKTLTELNDMSVPYFIQNKVAYNGRVNAIMLDTLANKWIGASDPDWEGNALELDSN